MESMFTLFDGLYLSWNPAMFAHQLTFHGYVFLTQSPLPL